MKNFFILFLLIFSSFSYSHDQCMVTLDYKMPDYVSGELTVPMYLKFTHITDKVDFRFTPKSDNHIEYFITIDDGNRRYNFHGKFEFNEYEPKYKFIKVIDLHDIEYQNSQHYFVDLHICSNLNLKGTELIFQ